MHQNQNPALNNRFPPPPPSSSAAHHSGLGPSWDATAFIQQQQQQQQQQIRQNGLFSPTNKGFPPSSSSASTSKSSPKNRHPNGSTRKTFILSLTLSFIAFLLLYTIPMPPESRSNWNLLKFESHCSFSKRKRNFNMGRLI